MLTKEYYDNMRTIASCLNWAKSVGLRVVKDKFYIEVQIKGSPNSDELDIGIVVGDVHDEVSFINMMNRLRKWKETK